MESGFVFFLVMCETIFIVCRAWAGGKGVVEFETCEN